MAARDLLLSLLAQNVAPSQAASAAGVTESYISQLLADETFQSDLSQMRVQVSAQDQAFDKNLEDTESVLLENIAKRAEFMNVQQSLVAFRILNQAHRRRDRKINAPEQTGTVVNITMPVTVIPRYVMNAQSEIVEVEGKTMISAVASQIDQTVRARNPQLSDQLNSKTAEAITTARHPSIPRVRAPRKNIVDLM